MIRFSISENVQELALGFVQATGLTIGESRPPLRDAVCQAVRRVSDGGMAGGEPRREAIRRMLRAGGFKPAGRNKPAQEYLLRTATESQSLPAIFNAVDLLNMISLESGLPISLLALQRFRDQPDPPGDSSSGTGAIVRYGHKDEKFVFNRAGQELELDGLICVCAGTSDASVPLGTPIKDSMAGKINELDQDVVAWLYAPRSAIDLEELTSWCNALGRGFVEHCGAAAFEVAAL